MFDHVTIRVSEHGASERFYDAVLTELGIEKTSAGEHFAEWGNFSLAGATGESPATSGLHIGFAAKSRADADAFWRAGIDAGHRSDGEPGPRPVYGDDYYGAFLLDPDGNSAEGALHDNVVRAAGVDHLWIRVADVARAKSFYELVAPHVGFRLTADRPDLARFSAAGGGSFSVVADGAEPTANLHMAFPAGSNGAVDEFHRALTAAGHPDNGAPGERPVYHDGYYGAFILDPDGNNVELVNHNRG
jgi:catechol 2,3-dioxygenase-like lactoylglutathione lyase family enzyme